MLTAVSPLSPSPESHSLPLQSPSSTAICLPSEQNSQGHQQNAELQSYHNTSHIPSHLGWTRQCCRRKRVLQDGERVRHTTTTTTITTITTCSFSPCIHCQEFLLEHQTALPLTYLQRTYVRTRQALSVSSHSVECDLLVCLTPLGPKILPCYLLGTPQPLLNVWLWDSTYAPISCSLVSLMILLLKGVSITRLGYRAMDTQISMSLSYWNVTKHCSTKSPEY